MTERAASSTAVLVCQGRATADRRYAVGQFSDPIARRLLDPAERIIVDQVRADRVPSGAADRMAYELVRRSGLTMVPRTIAIDHAIRDHGAPQVVILGAGLDARAWRMPELARTTVFEVDHPASQQDKLRRIGVLAPTARQVVPVAIDLANERIGPALERAGFDREVVTTWVWEGVVPYLTVHDVRATVNEIAELSAADSRLVVNYETRSLSNTMMRPAMRLVMRVSRQPDPLAAEPWRSTWQPDQIRIMLTSNAFDILLDTDLLTLSSGLTLPSSANNSLRSGRVALAVRL